MSVYEKIDYALQKWGAQHGVAWLCNYQDTEVRTFYLNNNRRDRVQVAVDAPENGQTIIRIGQNRRGLSRLNRIENITSSISDLSLSLDKALRIASEWASE